MKLNFKEDPKEWRKSAWLTTLGLAVLSSALRWRWHLPVNVWCALLVLLGLASVCAWLQPRWFRGWYRCSLRLGFYSGQFLGRCALILLFIFVLTPFGFVLRRLGKDPLQLKRPPAAATYWHSSKDSSPLDRLF
jgi:DMSO/TMAO reductase YedYZ heme-binding membrane subunit